jgi:isopentenyl phosphate kinase
MNADSVHGENVSLLVVKIGGSLFSDKRKSRTVDDCALREYAAAIAELWNLAPGQVAFVSGGGAFGHDAVRSLDPVDPHATLPLTEATFALKWLWTEALRSFGCRAVPLQIAALAYQEGGQVHFQDRVVRRMLDSGVLPVLSGDVTVTADGSLQVLGSDRVPELLLDPQPGLVRVAMLTDVPGILLDGPGGSETLCTVDPAEPQAAARAVWGTPEWDTSDSMAGKLDAALAIAQRGAECFILKGEPRIDFMRYLLEPRDSWPPEMRYTRVGSTRPRAVDRGDRAAVR